jgi:hypothetical protein
LAVFVCRRNRFYRIYIRADELLCIWAGDGSEGMAGARAVAREYGPLGALIGTAAGRALDPTKKNLTRRELIDQAPLEQLTGDHPKNLRAPLKEFEEVRIHPRSDRHARLYSDHGHQALLSLRHRSLGSYRLGIAAMEDVRIAMRELPRVLGDVCQVEVPWPEHEQRCGCRFCT